MFLNVVNIFWLFYCYHPLEKRVAIHINNVKLPLLKDDVVSSMEEIVQACSNICVLNVPFKLTIKCRKFLHSEYVPNSYNNLNTHNRKIFVKSFSNIPLEPSTCLAGAFNTGQVNSFTNDEYNWIAQSKYTIEHHIALHYFEWHTMWIIIVFFSLYSIQLDNIYWHHKTLKF